MSLAEQQLVDVTLKFSCFPSIVTFRAKETGHVVGVVQIVRLETSDKERQSYSCNEFYQTRERHESASSNPVVPIPSQ